MESIIIIVIIIFLAFFFQAMFGFGAGLISVPLLSIFLGVKNAVPIILLFQLFSGLVLCKSIIKNIKFKEVILLFTGLTIGGITGVLLLSELNEVILKKFLAVIILLFLIKELFFKNLKVKTKHNNIFGFIIGTLGGIFQGLMGTGGPPLVIYYTNTYKKKKLIRSYLIFSFLFVNIVRIISSVYTGLINYSIIKDSIIIFPFFLIAVYLGSKLHFKINENWYKIIVYLMLFVTCIKLMVG